MVHKKVRYINDGVDKSGSSLSPTYLINKFNLKVTLLQAFGIMCAIQASWKSEIRIKFGKRFPVVKSQNMEGLFRTKMGEQFPI